MIGVNRIFQLFLKIYFCVALLLLTNFTPLWLSDETSITRIRCHFSRVALHCLITPSWKLDWPMMYVRKLHKCLFSDSCRFKSNCYLWHLKPLLLQTLSHSDVKMKPSLIIFLLLAISCNANEILQLGQWLSTPSFDFSYLSSEEKSLCQKHLEYYTQSLSNGIPQSWALKSKSTIHVLFQC